MSPKLPEPGILKRHVDESENVVITGISGSFPDSDGVYQLRDNLMNKVDLINDDHRRWFSNNPFIPQRGGKIFNIEKFDADFFDITPKEANGMCPMSRMFLEKVYEAIVDAGFHPKELSGTKTGVFVGVCITESENMWYNEDNENVTVVGCSRSMLANRVSHWLNITGPSFAIDTACSSSFFALEQAYQSIQNGTCDAAIVGGTNLCLAPLITLHFSRLGVLSLDGTCRSFDNDGSGYVRSETVAAIFLQKAKNSRRIYATVCHAKTNCDGYKPEGITYPSSKMQQKLLEDFYSECSIPPETLAYVEAHGTGTKVGDPEEGTTIDNIFCKNRKTPLKIGCVKSNLGHSEPASGLCSIAKVIIAFETGIIPPNINYKSPRKGITALEEGRIEIITEPTPLDGNYVGVNSFGFGGANCHVLLKKNKREKNTQFVFNDDIPRLVCVSGRTKNAIEVLLDDIESHSLDFEFIRLLQEVFKYDTKGHHYRGFILLQKTEPHIIMKEIAYFPYEKRPIWFIFSGIGSQFSGMGSTLMKIPVFAAAIYKCDKVLNPLGIDIVQVITSKDSVMLDNILYSFVGIAAIQIGLVDILSNLGIVPNKIVGYSSVGELGCAYVDKCITAEQMISIAYCYGSAIKKFKLQKRAMYEVGLNQEKLKTILPLEIDVADYNDIDLTSISGPIPLINTFVKFLKEQNINVQKIHCSDIPLHSRYIYESRTWLINELSNIITKPKLRSSIWISSSVHKSQLHTDNAKYCSAEYFTNSYLSSVLFDDICCDIPPYAITIEIGVQDFIQPILKRSLPNSVLNMTLVSSKKIGIDSLLTSLGRLYNKGVNFNLTDLYPKISFPVSRGTPMLSPLVRWQHSQDFYVAYSKKKESNKSGERHVTINLKDQDYSYIAGHVIDGRNLYPATGYLHLVWESICLMEDNIVDETAVIFEDVRFLRATTITKEVDVEFTIMINKGSGTFEIIESNTAVVTGKVKVYDNIDKEMVNLPNTAEDFSSSICLSSRDVYKELLLRGYNYKDLFRSVLKTECKNKVAHIQWVKNYVAFMDNMLQVQLLNYDTRNLYVPISIGRVVIDPVLHKKLILNTENSTDDCYIKTYYYKDLGILKAGGIEIHDLKANSIQKRESLGDPVLEQQIFVPLKNFKTFNTIDAMRVLIQLALENTPTIKVKTVEIHSSANEPLAEYVQTVLGDLPLIQPETIVLSKNEIEFSSAILVENKDISTESNAMFVIGNDLLHQPEALSAAKNALKDNGYIISREKLEPQFTEPEGFSILAEIQTDNEKLILLKNKARAPKAIIVEVTSNTAFDWLEKVKTVIKNNQPLILYSQNDPSSGLIGFVNCLNKEPGGHLIKAFFIVDSNAPKFDCSLEFYKNQIEKNLLINIYKNGEWGCLRHLSMQVETTKTENAYVDIKTTGDLSTLAWYEGPPCKFENDCIIDIYYAALNFRDVMITTGKLKADYIKQTYTSFHCVHGLEFSGRNKQGERVAGMVTGGGLATKIKCDPNLLWTVPDKWSLEEAATVPVVYGTVYYALIYKGKLKRGQSILIHAGSGGVGQAAINVALSYGCDIFTTVGTPEKRAFIRENFPQIPETHIGNSRDTSFEQMVLHETKGKGVDMVLNSLAEEKLQASLRCLANGGQFFEIGKYDLQKNNTIGMKIFLKQLSFYGIMLDNLFYESSEVKKYLQELLDVGLKDGTIKPLIRTVFQEEEIEQAFRYMATGKHIGKVLIKIRSEEEQKIIIPKKRIVSAIPQVFCDSVQSVIIIGGLGGFGLELSNWLIYRGVRKVVLSSRNGVTKGYQEFQISKWRSHGIDVQISTANVATIEGCQHLIETANKMGPVFAIFNLSAVLRDALFENQTADNFKTSFEGKVYGTKNLDYLSRTMCPNLEHFVVFSSVSCGRGNAGQTNYGMANSIMERICEKRKVDGLPALAIQWGAIGEVGLVADMQENDTLLEIGGTLQQRIDSCLKVLDRFLRQNSPVVASMVVAEKKRSSKGDSLFTSIANILGVRDTKSISIHSTLAELGMDSMTAVEIKQTLEREYEVFLTAQDIRALTFAKILEIQNAFQSASQKETNLSQTNKNIYILIRTICDEDLHDKALVPLKTKASNSTNECPVFFLAGIEGQYLLFNNVCGNLNFKAACLQLDLNHLGPTVEDYVESLLPIIKSNLKPGGFFKFVAYSFGALIATEIILRLEADGYNGKAVFIDGSASLSKALVNIYLETLTEIQLETVLLCGIMEVISSKYSPELRLELDQCSDWNSKLALFLTRLPMNMKYSPEFVSKFCNGILARVMSIPKYKSNVTNKLKCPILLVRPSIKTMKDIAEDYELSNFFDTPCTISIIEGDHLSILDNPELSILINDFFSHKPSVKNIEVKFCG